MTNPNEAERGTTDYGPDVLAQLKAELENLSQAEDEAVGEIANVDSGLPQLLAGFNGVYRDNVQRSVDLFFEKDEPLDAARRARLVTALEPTLSDRRLRHGPLQLLLRAARRDQGWDTQQVAETAGIDRSLLTRLEESEDSIKRSTVPPANLANWIRTVAINTDVAIRCLKYTLASERGGQVFADEDRLELDADAQQYVDEVRALLA